MTISKEQSIGKIGEHLVCADLIGQGYMAFIVAEGLNYDVIVDTSGKIYRLQVRTTQKMKIYTRERKGRIYTTKAHRFYIHQGKDYHRPEKYEVDMFAFVALDINKIAYVPFVDILNKEGKIKRLVEFSHGNRWGKTFEDFKEFPHEI